MLSRGTLPNMTISGEVLDARAATLRRALVLEYLTVGWNLIEGGVGLTAAVLAGSIALLGFGLNSFIECASGLVLGWRLTAEWRGLDQEPVKQIDRRARRLVGASLGLLGVYLVRGRHPGALAPVPAAPEYRRHRPQGALPVRDGLARAGEAPCGGGPGRPGTPGGRLPDHRLLLVFAHHARRHRAEHAPSLVVGRPGGRSRGSSRGRVWRPGSVRRADESVAEAKVTQPSPMGIAARLVRSTTLVPSPW